MDYLMPSSEVCSEQLICASINDGEVFKSLRLSPRMQSKYPLRACFIEFISEVATCNFRCALKGRCDPMNILICSDKTQVDL